MRVEKVCCLCFFPCIDYKFIQDDSGDCTEIYDVTVKYFDPMILTEEMSCVSTSSRVICCGCWTHIYEFHEFQQRVLESRTSLHLANDTKEVAHFMKALTEIQVERKYILGDDDITNREFIDVASDQDDEMPLINLIQETQVRSRTKQSTTTSMGDTIQFHTKSCNTNSHVNDEAKDQLITPCTGLISGTGNLRRNLLLSTDLSVNDFNSTTVKIEHGSETNYEILPATIQIKELSSEEIQPDERCKNEQSISENDKSKRRVRMTKKILNDQKKVSSSSNTSGKLFGTVRKKNKSELRKDKNSDNGKLKDKSMENDIFISKWKPILDCDLCTTTVSNFDEMRDHFRAEHNTRCYIKCCERKFYRRYVLTEHIRLHVNPETHKCDICGKRSTTKYNLKLHKQVVHSESKQFECDICNRFFNQKPTLDRHLLTHMKGDKKFFCKECNRGYVMEDQLKYHIKTVHNVDRVCDQCGKTIHGVAALKKHLMEHAGIARRKYPCEICGVELVTNYGLRRHKAAYHHDGSTAYVCGICGKVASSHNALVSHKKNVHENGRSYKCTYCDKAFKRAKVLREHIATHTGVDLYQCPHCPQTFKVSANMHHHRKRAHHVEWQEGRKNRTALPKVNIQQVTNQVVL